MMAVKLTKEQQNAVDANGTVLVAAAAGSGKTAVLVERVLRLINDTKNTINAENLLIVTFTNAAAAEMRGRIEKRIEEECLKQPNNKHLRVQKIRIKNAKIGTIDSFCIDLVRNNFHSLGLNSDIKIVTEQDVADIKDEVLSNLIEEYFEKCPKDFGILIQSLENGYGIDDFKNCVYNIYSKSKSMPFCEVWLNDCKEKYSVPFNSSEWFNDILDEAKLTAEDCIYSMNQIFAEIKDENVIKEKCSELFFGVLSQLEDLKNSAENKDWDSIYSFINGFEFESFGAKIKSCENANVKSIIKQHRENIIERIDGLQKPFYDKLDIVNKDVELSGKYANVLIDFVVEFSGRFEKSLVDNNSMTFNMAEHFALDLLSEYQDGKIIYKPLAKELSDTFSEVLVDEFQDVNDLQDSLFYALSNGGKKLFMVGDVKQSIYGFRNANPENFIDKKENFCDYDDKHYPARVILDVNFRSREGVCQYINFLFEKIMSKQASGIEYDNLEHLVSKAEFPENEQTDTDILLINSDNDEDKEKDVEIKHIIQYIKNTVGKKILRGTDGTLREAEYRDFAVLLRSANTHGPDFCKAFKDAEIPVCFNDNEFAETSEILTVMAVLKALNTPSDSISMLSTLTGPVFNFSFNDVAEIRAENKSKTLFGSITLAAEHNEKCSKFLKEFRSLKKVMLTKSLPDFLISLYSKYSIVEIFSATENGEARKNNLLSLISLSERFSDETQFGVASFIKYFEKLNAADGFKNLTYSSKQNGVKIMSIHASKGLQFPICIVAQCSKRFNDDDLRKPVSVSDKKGIAISIKSNEEKIVVKPASKYAVNLNLKKKLLQEEMRILYVALTRAEEKLVLSIAANDVLEKFRKCTCNIGSIDSVLIDNHLGNSTVLDSKSYSDWILSSLIFHPYSKNLCKEAGLNNIPCVSDYIAPVNIIISELSGETAQEETKTDVPVNIKNIEAIKENLLWRYPYEDVMKNRAKAGVSEILEMNNDYEFKFSKRPEYLYKNGLTPTERGNLSHKVLELIDFKKAKEDLSAELDHLTQWEYLSEEEIENLNKPQIENFLNSKLCERIINSDFVRKEQKFIIDYTSKEDDIENLILQGCADLIFEENGKIILVDFKTSVLFKDTEFKTKYDKQLSIYAKALEEVFSLPVGEKIIYSLYLNKEIIL